MRVCLLSASQQVQMMLPRRFKSKRKSRRKLSTMTRSQSLQMITISISSWVLAAIRITNIKHLSNNTSQSLTITTGLKRRLSTIFRINLASRSSPPRPSSRASSPQQHWTPHQLICSSMMTWTLRRGSEFWRQNMPTRRGHTCSSRSKRQRTYSNRRGGATGRSNCSSGQQNAIIS